MKNQTAHSMVLVVTLLTTFTIMALFVFYFRISLSKSLIASLNIGALIYALGVAFITILKLR